ncbi:hypothetical protein Tco_1015263 [Tanacetum coccineum]|uniref:Uncharacterized protein n=1 Tax=Tanacetum coccineum TaxID=301880 RepID=A0ABQ5FLN5_9ASTR
MTDRSDGMMTGVFISGLHPGRLFKDLIARPPLSLEDLYTQANNFIRAEEANNGNWLREVKRGALDNISNLTYKDFLKNSMDKYVPQTGTRHVERSNHQRGIFTPLIKTPAEIYATSEGRAIFRPPTKMYTPPHQRDKTRYCEFHGDHGHDTNNFIDLRKEIKACIRNGCLSHLTKGATAQNNIQTSGPSGPPKKVRGPTQKNELWNMNKNKIVIKFNKYGKPMGVEGNELTQFLGSVVRIAGNVGLHCEDCRKVDKEKKGRHVFNDEVKSRNYDPALSVEEIMERQTDSRVNPEQFQVLVNRWMKPEYQGQNHLLGLPKKRLLKIMGCIQHKGNYTKLAAPGKDGSIVNDKAAQVVASLQVVANDFTNTQGIQEDDWTNDDLSKVKGPEKRGYVRCVGKMLSLRNNGASSSTSSQTVEHRLAQTEDVLYTLVNLLKDPTANSNLPDILRSMNIQIPDNFSPGQNNSTNGNLGNSDKRSSVADQNIDSWGIERSKVITMLAAFDEVTIRW